MGLDGFELMLATEARFGIEFTPEETLRLRTVRDVIDTIAQKVQVKPSEGTCLNLRAFHRVRHVFKDVLGTHARTIRPETSLEVLIPRKNRKRFFKELTRTLEIKEWRLGFPQWVVWIALASGALAGSISSQAIDAHVFIYYCIFLIFTLLTLGLFHPLKIEFTRHMFSVGHLVRAVAAAHGQTWQTPMPSYSYQEIRATVRQIIEEQTAIPPTYSDDARIVDDLGID